MNDPYDADLLLLIQWLLQQVFVFLQTPVFAPPGWQPRPPRPDRAVILQIDLSLMKHLALLDNYYDILAPQVYTHFSNDDYTALFTLYKVIYPNYVSRHYVQDLYELIVDTFLKRWSLHIRVFPIRDTTWQVRAQPHANHHSGRPPKDLPTMANASDSSIPPNP